MEDAFGTAFEAEEHVAIVVQLAALHEGREVRREFLDLQTGDVLREIFRVRADVADAPGRAAAFRVGAPGGLLLAGG